MIRIGMFCAIAVGALGVPSAWAGDVAESGRGDDDSAADTATEALEKGATANGAGDNGDTGPTSPTSASPPKLAGDGAAPKSAIRNPSAPDATTVRTERVADVQSAEAPPVSAWNLSGYVQPQFDFRYRPQAFPRDRTDYGARATRTGIVIAGAPLPRWNFEFHTVISAGVLNTISNVENVDRNGDGAPDSLSVTRDSSAGLFIERATVSYSPHESVSIDLGQMRIPFTSQSQSPNTALMFPDRATPTQVFVRGTDLGGLVRVRSSLGSASVGVFNGTGSNNTSSSERGVLYAARVDITPLGDFPFSESATRGTSLRLGLGAGLLYFPSTRFDTSGFEGQKARDLRASLSLRMAVAGLYLQGEVLRRQQTDSLTSRPLVATGGYAQASYYIPVRKNQLGFAPIGRIGVTFEDQSFDPRRTVFTEAGVSVYIHLGRQDKDVIKLTALYLGELRLTEGEDAHGAITQAQLRW